MSVPGVNNLHASVPHGGVPAGHPLGAQVSLVQRVVDPILHALKNAFPKACKYTLRTLPVQIILAVMHPLHGVVLTFAALHLGTLATFTVCFSIYNHFKKAALQLPTTQLQTVPVTSGAHENSLVSDPTVLPELSKFRITKKLYEQLQVKEMPNFTPLSIQQVDQLLAVEPSLYTTIVDNQKMTAYHCFSSIHERGDIYGRIDDRASNEDFKKQMRYVLYTINQETDQAKQKKALRELAKGCQACLPNTRTFLGMTVMRLLSSGAFETQLDIFLANARDNAVEAAIYELFPHLKTIVPWSSKDQFDHIKSGFLSVYRKEIGLNRPGAFQDLNKNESVARSKRDQFLKIFRQKVNIKAIIADFILMINKDKEDKDIPIRNEDFLVWWGNNNLGDDWFYDEAIIYPGYFPKPNDDQKSLIKAYITEEAAIKTFEKLNYIGKS